MNKTILSLLLLSCITAQAQVAEAGKPLPEWKEGYLDLHHINTGRGNAAYFVFPDGTTMLADAGELDPTNPRTTSKRNTPMRPDNSKHPYEWIAGYIQQVAPQQYNKGIDYALITHFHDDHFGSYYPGAPMSSSKKYVLTGITGVGTLLPFHYLLQRDEHYPVSMSTILGRLPQDTHYKTTWSNYQAFIQEQSANGMQLQYFKAGSATQVHLLHRSYPDFGVQNVKSNGLIWTGKDSSVAQHFPPVDSANAKTWPDENALSNVLLIHYGPFVYYTGGDCPGNVFLGDAAWRDVETPIAQAVGAVDVATMDHHGNRDAVNANMVKTLQPAVWIEQVWTADHPGHETLIRVISPYLYTAKRDLFATNMMEANELVIGPLVQQSYRSTQGHILVRVLPGGHQYYIIILDDSKPGKTVKAVFGPYEVKAKN
ncbi:ComEC/Rec2 family competence protein [Deminuibacter soli]|uniref:MBL fold metallo-hydrolase n=1 Tax=Deminuibacter soli TaxID=2291815 RepID=A0A3E1NHC7_9BACT|nr:hypothetical protein [Deminuibacter soli]RFM27261.1 hypothetical protein DXN05_14605 [Deminuibacter soli]